MSTKSEIVTNLATEWGSENFWACFETNLPGFVNLNPNPKPGFGLEIKPETRVCNLAGFCIHYPHGTAAHLGIHTQP